MKTLIINGRVINPATNTDEIMSLLVIDNKIKLLKNLDFEQQEADKVIDATNMWVVPGLVDVHTHLREPGYENKEEIKTGAQSAAKGGFTTICCMPNTNPVIDNIETIKYVQEKAKETLINILPIGSITKGQQGEIVSNIQEMKNAGVCAISEDGKTVKNAGLMKEAMRQAAENSIPVFSHCEDVYLAGKGQINSGATANRLNLEGISDDSEEVIVARDIILAKDLYATLHICHISTKGSVQIVRDAKKSGIKVSCEATPHHFTLTDESITGLDTNYKMNPPLRAEKDVEAIKQALKDGTINIIATDHAPHSFEEKSSSFEKAPFGIVGFETALALSITELVNTGILTPIELIEKMSYNPSKLIGINKGNIDNDYIADIVIIDPNEKWTVDVNKFASKGKNSPFDGITLTGKVKYTIVDGKIVYSDI